MQVSCQLSLNTDHLNSIPNKLSKAIAMKSVTRHFYEEIEQASKKEEILKESQEVLNINSSIDDKINSFKKEIRKQIESKSVQIPASQKTALVLAISQPLNDLSNLFSSVKQKHKKISDWIIDYQKLVGPIMYKQLKFYERQNLVLSKEKQILELEKTSLKESANMNADQMIFMHLNEKVKYSQEIIDQKEKVIKKMQKKYLHKKFEMNSRLLSLYQTQSSLLATIDSLKKDKENIFPSNVDSIEKTMSPFFVLPVGLDKTIRSYQENASLKDKMEEYIERIKGRISPDKTIKEFPKRADMDYLFSRNSVEKKNPSKSIILDNFKKFFNDKKSKLNEIEEKRIVLAEMESNLQNLEEIKNLENMTKSQSLNQRFKIQSPPLKEMKNSAQVELETLHKDLEIAQNQIKIIKNDVIGFKEGNLRKFNKIDMSTRKLLETENKRIKKLISEIKQIIQKSAISESFSSAFKTALNFYSQHQHAYFNMNKFVETEEKKSSENEKKEPFCKKYKYLKNDLSKLIQKGAQKQQENSPKAEHLQKESELLCALSENIEQIEKLNNVLDLTIQENRELYENNRKAQFKMMTAERQLDEERLRLFKLEEEHLKSIKDSSENQETIKEKNEQIKRQAEKVKRLKMKNNELIMEKNELQSKLTENAERINELLSHLSILEKKNMELQIDFEKLTKNYQKFVQESNEIKSKYQNLKQEYKVVEKLMKINNEKLQRKENEVNDLASKINVLENTKDYKTGDKDFLKNLLIGEDHLSDHSKGKSRFSLNDKKNLGTSEKDLHNQELKKKIEFLTKKLLNESNMNNELSKRLENYENKEKRDLKARISQLEKQLVQSDSSNPFTSKYNQLTNSANIKKIDDFTSTNLSHHIQNSTSEMNHQKRRKDELSETFKEDVIDNIFVGSSKESSIENKNVSSRRSNDNREMVDSEKNSNILSNNSEKKKDDQHSEDFQEKTE